MTTKRKGKLNFTTTFIIAVLLLIVALITSILFGDAKIHLSTIFEAIFNYDPKNQQHNIISEIRIPRDIGAILVGVGLNSGASFMLALTFAFYPTAPFIVMMFAGFIGALMGGFIVLMIGRSRSDGFNPMRIILAGAAVSALLTALSQGVALLFRLNQSLTFWSAGGVSGTTWNQLMWAAPFILIALVIIISMSKQLTILNLGETLAKGLGQNVAFTRAITLILSMIMAGIAVAMVGQIAFVGLMVPHIVRYLVGTDYARVIPLTAVVGGLLLLVADTVARMLGEAPVGAIISFIGVPYFLYLVKRGGRFS